MKRIVTIAIHTIAVASIAQLVLADSATWKTQPVDNDWYNAANWKPETVPNGPDDVATFNISNTTVAVVNAATEIAEIVFNVGAGAFQIRVDNFSLMTVSGVGITNLSGKTQALVTSSFGNEWRFINKATAGDAVDLTNNREGKISFYDTATAGSATFANHGPLAVTGGYGISFFDDSNAGTATFFNESEPTGSPALIDFAGNSSAASATFFNQGPTVPGQIIFADESTAANATFFNDFGTIGFGGNSTAAEATFTISDFGTVYFNTNATAGSSTINNEGGYLYFYTGATAGEATITNSNVSATEFYGGTAGNCTLIATGDVAAILFYKGDGGISRIELFGNGNLDISQSDEPSTTIGSLEGDGFVFLGSNNLTNGSNNLSTTFTGIVLGFGSLTKNGTGTLTLTAANVYTGGTTITDGALLISNQTGSGTGEGAVSVKGGILGGTGTIVGSVTVGGGVLEPGDSETPTALLTIGSNLSLVADAVLSIRIDSNAVSAGGVIANSITINGAQFSGSDVGNAVLPAGTVFTVINNISATAISGGFDNLPEGGMITIGSNTFQANYGGGDGNDLTLTTVLNTATPSPTSTPTATPPSTATPTAPPPSPTATATATATATPTPTPRVTPTPRSSPTPRLRPTPAPRP